MERRHFLAGTVAGTAGLVFAGTSFAPLAHAAEVRMMEINGSSSNSNIKALQHLLNAYSIKDDSGAALAADGSYGPKTEQGVENFQKSKGLTVDGNAGPATMKALVGAANTEVGLNWSNKNSAKAVEQLLVKRGGKAADGGALPVDGSFDSRDVELVKHFQKADGITVTGTVDYLTWSHLVNPVVKPGAGASMMVTQSDGSAEQWGNCGPASLISMMLRMGVTPKNWSHGIKESTSALKDVDAVKYMRGTVLKMPLGTDSGTAGISASTIASRVNAGTGIDNAKAGGDVQSAMSNVRSGGVSMLSGDLAVAAKWNGRSTGYTSHWIALLEYDGSKYRVCEPSSQNNKLVWVTESQLVSFVHSGGNTSVLFPA